MILLLVILLGIYLRELRTENVYEAIKPPLFRKEGAGGRFNYCNLFKINLPNPSLQKRGFFMILLLVILLGIYLRELRTENVYEAIKLPSFVKRGLGGDLTTSTYPKPISPSFQYVLFQHSMQGCSDKKRRHVPRISLYFQPQFLLRFLNNPQKSQGKSRRFF